MIRSCANRQQYPLRRHLRLTWEDGVFGVITPLFFLSGHGPLLFHLYTIGIVILVMSLAFRRGLAVGMVRMLFLSAVLFSLQALGGQPFKLPLMEIAGMTACGVISGLVGEMHHKSHEALERSFCQTIDVLARSLECRDPYTEGHSRRTAQYAVEIAEEMGLDEEMTTTIEQAGLLHDLGKMGMPDAILRKQGILTPEEEQQARRHPDEGSRILRNIPSLSKAAELVRHHHEHYDGSGYPDHLADGAIPLGARILTVADVFDALTTDRPYRKAVERAVALRQMHSEMGRLFDPEALEALQRVGAKRNWLNESSTVIKEVA